jgi:hypothetical protein
METGGGSFAITLTDFRVEFGYSATGCGGSWPTRLMPASICSITSRITATRA